MKKILLISGKALSSKDTSAQFMASYLESKGERVLICHYADLLKYICKTFFNWNGVKDDNGRTILQHVGTDVIRIKNDRPNYWVNFIIDILWMFYDEWDYIIIPDTRFPNEIEEMKSEFNYSKDYNLVQSIRINRPNFDSGLSIEQLTHPSECALDGYEFDYYIENNGTLKDLQLKCENLVDKLIQM